MEISIVSRVIERLAETLERSVIPQLADAYAVQQAGATAALLRVLAPLLELKHEVLEQENARMIDVLERAASALGSAATSTDLAARLGQGISAGRTGTLDARHLALKTAFADLIDNFVLLQQAAGEKASAETEREMHAVLRAQIDFNTSHWAGTVNG